MTYSKIHIDRAARHQFWIEHYRTDKRRQRRIALVAFLLIFAVIAGLGLALDKPYRASWDGQTWSCPAGGDVWADQQEAIAGKDFVYCVK